MLQPTGSQRIRDHSANEQQTQLYSGVDTLFCTCSFSCNPYPPVCLPTDSKAPTLPIGCLPPILSPYHSQLCIVQPKTEKMTAKITAVNTQKKTLNKFLPPVYCHCLSLYFGVNHLKINFRHQGTSPLKIKTIFLPSGNTLII